MKNTVANEPVLAAMIARLIVGWASAKGLELTIDQVLIVVTVIETVLAYFVRKSVTPGARTVPPPPPEADA